MHVPIHNFPNFRLSNKIVLVEETENPARVTILILLKGNKYIQLTMLQLIVQNLQMLNKGSLNLHPRTPMLKVYPQLQGMSQ